MKRVIMLLIVLSLAVAAEAASFRLLDAVTKEPIPDSYVLMKLYGPDKYVQEISATSKNGFIDLVVPSGKYDLGVYVDVLDTPGKDYYADVDVIIDDYSKEIFVLPVASLSGRAVYDNNVVATNAGLSFDCDKDFGLAYPKQTDAVGYFSVAYIPPGGCVIAARLGNKYASQQITLVPGEKKEIVIELNQELPSRMPIIVILMIVVLVIIGFLFFRRKKKVPKLAPEEVQAAVKLMRMTDKETLNRIAKDERIQGILATLNKDERAVVDFLLNHKFKASQPQIFKVTLIPKTTLARQLINLQSKNIIQTRKIRKIKEAELTDWFIKEYK